MCVQKSNYPDVNETQITQNSNSSAAHGSVLAVSAKATLHNRMVEKIRSELNIEKWPAIWQPAKSKNKPALRVMSRNFVADDGTRITSRVEVGYTQLGTLSTEEQKLLYVLIQLWEEDGKPDVQVFFSTRGLARSLRKKGWGTNVIESITKSLRKLRTIPIEWINSYHDQKETGRVLVDRRPFSILGDLRIVERRQDGAVNSSLGYFKFDDNILRNLQLNYTKPVCIEEFFKLKSEIAQLVYSHVDLMLFDKSRYERRSRELFDDLGLKNAEYNHMYERKRALERAVKELTGIRLSSGVLKSAVLEKTKDGKDYKVVFTKSLSGRQELLADERPEGAVAPTVVVNHYSEQKEPLLLDAEELVRYFHKVFHSVVAHTPQTKETEQALSLISQHGSEIAKRVVDFARTEAAKTGYQVQHFGAVLSYTSRTIADVGRVTKIPPAKLAEPKKPAPAVAHHERGERRFAHLSPEEYDRRAEQARDRLFAEQPFFAHARVRQSALVNRAIRTRIVMELETEPQDLIVFDPTLASRYPWLFGSSQNLPLWAPKNCRTRKTSSALRNRRMDGVFCVWASASNLARHPKLIEASKDHIAVTPCRDYANTAPMERRLSPALNRPRGSFPKTAWCSVHRRNWSPYLGA